MAMWNGSSLLPACGERVPKAGEGRRSRCVSRLHNAFEAGVARIRPAVASGSTGCRHVPRSRVRCAYLGYAAPRRRGEGMGVLAMRKGDVTRRISLLASFSGETTKGEPSHANQKSAASSQTGEVTKQISSAPTLKGSVTRKISSLTNQKGAASRRISETTRNMSARATLSGELTRKKESRTRTRKVRRRGR